MVFSEEELYERVRSYFDRYKECSCINGRSWFLYTLKIGRKIQRTTRSFKIVVA